MNKYAELKQKQEKEVNEFPFIFAFNKEQLTEGMEKLGLTKEDTNKICSIGGGGYIRKSDGEKMKDMFKRHKEELKNAIEEDGTGNGFIYDMFNYELGNHEYRITYDLTDTLEALDLTIEEIKKNQKLLQGLEKAIKSQEEFNY